MSPAQRAIALVVPWAFVLVLVGAYGLVALPRLSTAGVLGAGVGVVLVTVLVSFVLAAITFSGDVVRGRWPD